MPERNRAFSPIVKYLAASLVVAGLLVFAFISYMDYESPVGGDFQLESRGKAWRFSDDAKELNLLYFGYTKCPDVCPMTLSVASQAFRRLNPEQLARTRLLFLSVDRDHEKPGDSAEYAGQFFPAFVGLSGTREEIDKVVSLYRASYTVEKNPKSYLGYSIAHTDRLYFLNRKGVVLDVLFSPRSPDQILKTMEENL